jgi:methylenetetrahydrofolate dehydrogenase (NADP+)/methenyltetrahydrofolate cyclohydrolase
MSTNSTKTIMMLAEPVVTEIKSRISAEIERLKEGRGGLKPKLVAILIGNDPVSRTYVDLKRKDCADVGITSEVIDLSDNTKEEMPRRVEDTLGRLNEDSSVNAVIPQMPFDGKVSEEFVFSTLRPEKDVDGLTPFNLGKLVRKEYSFDDALLPCTPKGVILLAKHYKVPIQGSDVAIIGRSTLVGEPVRKLFQDLNATATCYHTASRRVSERIKEADIIVVASGRPPELYGKSGFRLTGEMVKEGSTVFSVGVRRDTVSGKMLFDTETATLKGKCSFASPNTGGVGAMTRACLLQNTLIATRNQLKKGLI